MTEAHAPRALPGSLAGEQPVWHRMSEAAGLVSPTGEVQETVFGRMTQLALSVDAVNLGQGAPGDPTPDFLLEAAHRAMLDGANQYPPAAGAPALREAIAEQRGHRVDPQDVLVTTGATEALTAAIVALAPLGTDVVVLEPYYDSYAAAAQLAGARLVPVGLDLREDGADVDLDRLAAAITDRTSIVLLNTPHNPTGLVLTEEQIRRIGALAAQADAWLLTDEVYEHLVFEGTHVAPASVLDDPRVVTVSSAGKTFNATGWKIGWVIGSPEVITAVRAVKQYLTFTTGAPFQPAIATALTDHGDFGARNAQGLARKRDVLTSALREVPGVRVAPAASGYFVLADFGRLVEEQGLTGGAFALNEHLSREVGVTGIPAPALCAAGSPTAQTLETVIRYSFCRTAAEVEEAAARLRASVRG
jgi:N-succinyldiaminopimelate aminotransferase